jgi:hypothetical protein
MIVRHERPDGIIESRLYDLASGEVIGEIDPWYLPQGVRFSPDGSKGPFSAMGLSIFGTVLAQLWIKSFTASISMLRFASGLRPEMRWSLVRIQLVAKPIRPTSTPSDSIQKPWYSLRILNTWTDFCSGPRLAPILSFVDSH